VHGRSHLEQLLLLHLARVLLSSDFSEHVPDIRVDKSARTLEQTRVRVYYNRRVCTHIIMDECARALDTGDE
jgi:hypothetical protein